MKYEISRIKTFRGQSLLEITVALGALSVLLTVSAMAIIGALSNAQEAKFQNQASIYAQQGIEILRQMRDSDWGSFNNLTGVYCMADICSTITANGACGKRVGTCGVSGINVVGIYRREVFIQKSDLKCSQGGVNATRAIVTVSWNDSKCSGAADFCRTVKVETCFSNLYGNTGI